MIEELKIELITFYEETQIPLQILRSTLEDLKFCESSNVKMMLKTEDEKICIDKIFEIRNKYSDKNNDIQKIDIMLFLQLYNLIKEEETTLRRK